MTDLAVIAQPGALDQYADAGEFVVLSCERAKEWLTKCIEHGEIEQIVELKSQAEAIRVYTTTKQLGRDAELAAAEIVRRAERGIGLAVRMGQANGSIRPPSKSVGNSTSRRDVDVPSPQEATGGMPLASLSAVYDLTDGISDEEFDEVIAEAKADGNLSRANVNRTVTRKKAQEESKAERPVIAKQMAAEGHTTAQIAEYLGMSRDGAKRFLDRHLIVVPADAVVGPRRKLDSNRIVNGTVEQVIGIDQMLDTIDYSALDRTQLDYWVSSLSDAIRSLTTLRNNLKKELTQ
jgi:hypothetical protein